MKEASQKVPRCTHSAQTNDKDLSGGLPDASAIATEKIPQNEEPTDAETIGIEKVEDAKELIEGIDERDASPERKLYLLARFCKDSQAAEDLWNRSIRSTQWLTEAILECPDLFANALQRSTELPICCR